MAAKASVILMTFTELFWERSEKSCQFPAWVRSPCYPHHHILCRFTLTTAFCPRLNNWLSLPTKWEAFLAWMHPLYKSLHSAYGAYVAAHTNTHTHTCIRAHKCIFGSIHKTTESSVSCLNILTESIFPAAEHLLSL